MASRSAEPDSGDPNPVGRAGGTEPVPRLRGRRAVRVVIGLVAALALVYGALWLVARSRLEALEPKPFFDARDRPLVVAHQGGELLRPSNTMAAFSHAVGLGVDVLDTDLHRTADGHLVLIHDQTVDRTSDGRGAVRDLTLAELEDLDFGYRFTVDDGLGAEPTHPYRGAGLGIVTVPQFFTVFESLHDDLRYGIEIKQTGPEAATELCRLIRGFEVGDRVLVSSFTQPNMDAFRLACPEVATSATASEVRDFVVAHRLGLNGLIRPGYDAFQVPRRVSGLTLLTEDFVDDAEAWGLPVVPWTIDDPDVMRELLDLGVAGINTNRPDLLVELVR